MAEVLILAGALALGFALGWRWRHRRDLRRLSQQTTATLISEWAEHVRLHAEGQAGSTVMTPPGLCAEARGRE